MRGYLPASGKATQRSTHADIVIPWQDRTDIRYWNEPDKGGHFAAFEQPALFTDEVRSFFRLIR